MMFTSRAVARDQHVAGLGAHRLGRYPAGPQPSLIVVYGLGVSVESDDLEVVGGGDSDGLP